MSSSSCCCDTAPLAAQHHFPDTNDWPNSAGGKLVQLQEDAPHRKDRAGETKLDFSGKQTPKGATLHPPQIARKEEKGATYSWAGIVELYGVLRAMLHKSWPRMESCPLHGQYNATGKRENGSGKTGQERRANRERYTCKTKTVIRRSYLCD